MASLPPLFLLTLVFLSSIHPSISRLVGPTKEIQLVDMVCKQTTDYAFCARTLDVDRRTPTADLKVLGHVAIDVALRNGIRTRTNIRKLIDQANHDRPMQQYLSACEDQYSRVLAGINRSNSDLNGEDYSLLKDDVQMVEGLPSACEDQFKGPPARRSPLTRQNDAMDKLVMIIQVIAGLLIG